MTVQQLAMSGALNFSGIHSLDPDDNAQSELARGKSASIIADCAAYINASMRLVADKAPHLFKKPGGGLLGAPLSVSGLGMTFGSTTITGFSAFASAMRGCTIRIAGSSYDHEIVSATEISRPFDGPTAGGLGATVYFDCIPLDVTISGIIGPVMIPSIGVIGLANSRDQFLTGGYNFASGSRSGLSHSVLPFSMNFTKLVGRPERWMCEEGGYDPSNTSTLLLMRFYPMPSQLYTVVFEKIMKPPVYTSADIDSDDGGADPGTTVPFDGVEQRLMPILTKKWMKHYSFDQPNTVKQEINDDYQNALDSLEKEKPTNDYKSAVYH